MKMRFFALWTVMLAAAVPGPFAAGTTSAFAFDIRPHKDLAEGVWIVPHRFSVHHPVSVDESGCRTGVVTGNHATLRLRLTPSTPRPLILEQRAGPFPRNSRQTRPKSPTVIQNIPKFTRGSAETKFDFGLRDRHGSA